MQFKKSPLLLLIAFALMGVASATIICNSNSLTLSYNTSAIPSNEITLTSCTNDANESSILFSGSSIPGHIEKGLNQDTIIGTKDIKIKVHSDIPIGDYPLTVSFSDGSMPITALVKIFQPTVVQGDILVFPTSNTITVQQGTSKSKNIQITVPTSYPRVITIQGVNFNPDVEAIRFDDLSLGQVSPGQTVNIPVIYDGTNAQVGTYQTNLNIFATDSQGAIYFPTVNLQLIVSAGITPADATTFQTRPTCSLSSSTMNLNQSYIFSCTGVSNNIDVNVPYNEYYEGISADTTSNIYQYTFKPVKFGVTNFFASFSYKGATIFSPFTQEIRIQSTSSSMGGTSLDLIFIPSLNTAKPNEQILIQVVDNTSRSLVDNPELYIDGLLVTNKSGQSFMTSFQTAKNYSIRAKAQGYNDLSSNYYLNQKPMVLTISPSTGDSRTMFNISTDVNATIYINSISRGNYYYGYLTSGSNEIKAFKEGYIDYSQNFTVDAAASAVSSGEFKKGVKQVITLNKNASWNVYYQKDMNTQRELKFSGSGTSIEITPDKVGTYTVETGGFQVWSGTIQGTNWNAKWWFMPWYLWVGGVLIIIFVFLYKRNGIGGGVSNVTPYS